MSRTATATRASVVICGLLTIAIPAAAQPLYEIELLPNPAEGSSAFDLAIGDNIHVVGEAPTDASPSQAIYWSDVGGGATTWHFELLPVEEPARPSRAKKLTIDTGLPTMVVGSSTELAKKKATLWTQPTEGIWDTYILPDMGGDTEATSIANFGLTPDVYVSGFTREADVPMKKATVWQMLDQNEFNMIPLPDPETTASWANDIGTFENANVVLAAVGGVDDINGRKLPAIWESADGVDWTFDTLPVLSSGFGEASSIAQKVKKATELEGGPFLKAKRTISGISGVPGEVHAVLWDFDGEQWQIHDLGVLPDGTASHAHDVVFDDVDLHTFIVGESTAKPVAKATLWIMNKKVEAFDLNDRVVNPIPNLVLESARALDPLGGIAGYGMMLGGAEGTLSHAFVLLPTGTTSVQGSSPMAQPRLTVTAYPNPGATRFQVAFRLPVPAEARLTVYDPAGRRVAALFDGRVGAGERTLVWDGRHDSGARASSGVYFLRLESAQGSATEKLLLTR